MVALNSSNRDFDFAGVTFRGAAGLGAMSEINSSPGEIKGLSFEMAGVDTAVLALALDDSAVVQGSPVVVRTALLDDALQVVDAPVEWAGRLDTMVIEEDGETCRVGVTAEASAVDLLRGSALTYSNADQQSLYPGDRAFEYIVAQSNTPVVWPSKEWLRALGPR